ncbi:MAG TPA: hypothetical protein VH593_15525 [Ktedonobacteraceae bacterium]
MSVSIPCWSYTNSSSLGCCWPTSSTSITYFPIKVCEPRISEPPAALPAEARDGPILAVPVLGGLHHDSRAAAWRTADADERQSTRTRPSAILALSSNRLCVFREQGLAFQGLGAGERAKRGLQEFRSLLQVVTARERTS